MFDVYCLFACGWEWGGEEGVMLGLAMKTLVSLLHFLIET